jgi:hypothetical protein
MLDESKLNDRIKINTVCIDNEEVRQRVINNEQIDVTTVPCILVIYADGNVEKYEGLDAFKWCEDIILKYVKEEEEKIYQQKMNQELQQQLQKEQYEKQRLYEQLQQNKNKKTKVKTKTSIDDLDPVDINENEEFEDIQEEEQDEIEFVEKRPPVSIRSGKGGYEVTEITGKIENNRKIATSSDVNKKNDLMSMAMQMQKSRETLESKIKK